MVKYTLVYFNGRGRAEVPRLLFAQAGVQYEDKRLQQEEWKALKPTIPSGQLPFLEIDGVRLGQSMAIARYLAREFSLYGANNLESSKIDELLDSIGEFFDRLTIAKFGDDDSSKEKALTAARVKAPVILKLLNDTLAKSGSGWLVGSKVSIADIAAYRFIATHVTKEGFPDIFEEMNKYNNFIEHRSKVANLPKIKEWIAKRPETSF